MNTTQHSTRWSTSGRSGLSKKSSKKFAVAVISASALVGVAACSSSDSADNSSSESSVVSSDENTDAANASSEDSTTADSDGSADEANDTEGSDESTSKSPGEAIDLEAIRAEIGNASVINPASGAEVALTDGHAGAPLGSRAAGEQIYIGSIFGVTDKIDPSTFKLAAGDFNGDGTEEVAVLVNNWGGSTSPAISGVTFLDADLNILGSFNVNETLAGMTFDATPYDTGSIAADGDKIIVKMRARTPQDPPRAPSQILEVPFAWDGDSSATVSGDATIYDNPSSSLDWPE